MRQPKVTLLQIAVHAGSLIPFIWLVWAYFTNHLTVNPIQAATQRTGRYALVLLVLSLTCSPLNTVFGFRQALKVRRALGLYAFLYAAMHFLIFSGLDYGFDWSLLREALFEKPYALIGLAAFVILLVLAITSFKWWMKLLGKNWKRLHRLVYLAGVLVVVHYAWAKKGDLLRLRGDIRQPLLFGIMIVILLILRIPTLAKWLTQTRLRITRKWVIHPKLLKIMSSQISEEDFRSLRASFHQ